MKVTKITEGIMTTQDTKFVYNKEQDVPKKVYDYLKKTFPTHFKFEEVEAPTPPKAPKPEVKEEKTVEEDVKPAKAPRGRKATK